MAAELPEGWKVFHSPAAITGGSPKGGRTAYAVRSKLALVEDGTTIPQEPKLAAMF
jgi:hypothetical protein